LADECVRLANELAGRLDNIRGVRAPVHDRHHFREFVARTDQPAAAVADDLEATGYAVHVVDEHEVQVCVTETNEGAIDAFVAAFEEAAR
jgi:glycine dehydrogenase subunit 1